MTTPTVKHVTTSRRRVIDAGGMYVSFVLQPQAAHALRELIDAGYGRSKAEAISRALIAAANTHKK